MVSPYELLYKSSPSYEHLRVFGVPCYPWQTPLKPSKLHSNAPPCIFMGYSPAHKRYICFNPSTNRNIISRHVIFLENSTPPIPPILLTPTTSSYIPPLLLQPTQIHSPTSASQASSSSSLVLRDPSSPPSCIHNSNTIPPPQTSPNPTQLPHRHPMVTRAQTGHSKPKTIFNLQHTLNSNLDPTSYHQASKHAHWHKAMQDEMSALHQQHTWTLTSPPPNIPILGSKWTFKTKRNSDGSIARYKARLVAQGFNQTHGLDYDETFSPVAKLPTIRLLFTTAAYNNWAIHQLDISNAFLHGQLQERVYMTQPKGFEDPTNPHAVCLLQKSIYELKQAPRQWHSALTDFLKSRGFSPSSADPSLFLRNNDGDKLFILIFIDDILLTGTNVSSIQTLITNLSQVFSTKSLGSPSTFLGVQITTTPTGYFLHQPSYIDNVLHIAGMTDCTPVQTPTFTSSVKSSATDPSPFSNPALIVAWRAACST